MTLLLGCNSGINSLIDDYNDNFTKADIIAKVPLPGEEGFDEKDMLFDYYYVYTTATVTLSAPENCDRYQWSVVDMKTGLDFTPRLFGSCKENERDFCVYIGDSYSKWQLGTTYRITLTVTKGGKDYSDTAGIVVFEYYDWLLEDLKALEAQQEAEKILEAEENAENTDKALNADYAVKEEI